MADKVQRALEDMVPELIDLGKRRVFTKDEIKEIICNRRTYEYKISSRTPILKDYLDYLNYEYELERIRYIRTRELGLKKRTIGDYSIIRLIHFIFKRALRKFPSDEKLWLQNIDFCLKSGSSKALQRNMIAALRNNPTKSIFWLLMSDRELQNGNLKEARSSILLGLRVNKESLLLWRGFVQLEINIAYKQYLYSFKNKSLSPRNLDIKDPSVTSLFPIINFSNKKFKNINKREALIVYVFRQYYKLKTTILGDGSDISVIKGMNELENTILEKIHEMKKKQPLFSVFSVLLGIINEKDNKSNLVDVFKNEMELAMNSNDVSCILLTLLFICRLIFNCIDENNNSPENKDDTALADHEIVDFGFEITDTFNFNEDNNTKNNDFIDIESSKTKNELSVFTWYSQTCIGSIVFNRKHCFRSIIELIRLDPNFWNTCFLENNDLDYLLNIFSKHHNIFEDSVSNREICKDTLFSIDLINDLKKKIKKHFLDESNVTKMRQVILSILSNVNKLEISGDLLLLKLSLSEAFESLFFKNFGVSLNDLTKEEEINCESLCELENNMDNIPMIIETIKHYIVKINNLKAVEVNGILFAIESTNKLFDLIKYQVEIEESKTSVLFDYIGFNKCICWLYLILSYNLDGYDSDLRFRVKKAIDRIINDSLCIIPTWFESRNIPNYVFNIILLHSIISNSISNNKGAFYNLFVEYLNNNKVKIDIILDYSLIVEIINKCDTIDSEIILNSTKSIFSISEKNKWIFNDEIQITSETSKSITSISFKLVCITLISFLYKKYLLRIIENETNNKSNNLSYDEKSLSKLFLLWESLMKDSENVRDITGEFYCSVSVNYLIFLRLIEYLKLKRYLSPNFCNSHGGNIRCISDLIRIIKRGNQNLLTKKLHFELNLSTILQIPLLDPKFIKFLGILSNNTGKKEDKDKYKLNTETETLRTLINSIMNQYNILSSTFEFIQRNYT
ncbi:small ribosomal subunit (SSU) processosome [Cryptosporidium ryanae]|uniref:small ribosomal subunit (SSU) processosome n=1 Tax=Cryptosporidium ryanae TaxID=515981 RepID=UPI00351A1E5F|nr:small ribosomal subunit (SSU) processosome [Cryptosporidium ryanae]